ncbi:endonuclease Q family protein [Paenibacillus sp. FA6]|uniref:endonuclease Q family protein n=1 Tax=Paenibacillus sp. FA6 TaxID=3413029 RepID=UPI003F65CF0D
MNPLNPSQEKLHEYYADLHIHIGRATDGQAVKITGSRNLTFANIAKEAAERKGIELIGIIDCHSPSVQNDILSCLHSGEMSEVEGGGIHYRGTTILLGCEIEFNEPGKGAAHVLTYFPNLDVIQQFSAWMSGHMTNINLSTQRIYVPVRALQEEVVQRGGIFIPAHVFTPHKGIYGNITSTMADILDVNLISGIELGLSADSMMAGMLSELDDVTFLSNSDAHSLGKIAREYNVMRLARPSFTEFRKALNREDGRRITANYGLNPRLGKYHRTYCNSCNLIIEDHVNTMTAQLCTHCGSSKVVQGVLDRINSIADRGEPFIPEHRPSYHYQVPLEFIPGLGKAKMNSLLTAFGTEMNILHQAQEESIATVVGSEMAQQIVKARNGSLNLTSGGGGIYGKVIRP